jgi:membrane dipeptidase
MTDHDLVPVFDGHNDTLLRLWMKNAADADRRFLEGTGDGHIDMPRAIEGGFAGGFFAMFPPPLEKADLDELLKVATYDVPLPPYLPQSEALRATVGMASILFRIERASQGRFAVCRTGGEMRAAITQGRMAAVFHIEGAEAIDPDLAALDLLHAAGLRSIGIVWSRPNVFGHGVPFRFPSSPDTGPGLTDAGKALVRECNRRRIMVDLSHLNEKGFRDVAAISNAPLVATHSNVHALCASARNLTDWQLSAIRESGGMVGLNFATGFLREDGRMISDTGIEVMIRHLDALVEALGEDGVGLGSDFDGAVIPRAIGDVAGLPRLIDAMKTHGYGRDLIEKIAWRNWAGMLGRTIGE